MTELSIIFCTYNEVERIEQSYNQVTKELNLADISYEILVIDNNSNDGTDAILKKLESTQTKIFFNSKNLGKGASIKLGIRYSSGKYIMIFDPDLEYAASDILPMYNMINNNNFDFIIGSRRLENKLQLSDLRKKSQTYLINYFGVYLLTGLINILYGEKLTDAASALKIFEAKFIKSIELKRNGFNLDFELVCKCSKNNGKLGEIQVEYYPRSIKEGKKIRAVKDGFSSLIAIVQDRF